MVQMTSTMGLAPLRSRVISRPQQFDKLFDGFHRLKAISYVVSPDLLLAFFEERGFDEVEIVVGENLAEQYRQVLSQKGQKVTQALAELIEQGKLKILVPKHTIHSKLYILQRDDGLRRIVQGSANLTETARRGASQVNYVWYGDFSQGDPWLAQVLGDYEIHLQDCSLFMGDLVELFRRRPDQDRGDLIDAWLKGRIAEDDELGESRFLQQLTVRSLESLAEPGAEPIFAIELPDAPKARQRLETRLATLSPVVDGRRMQLSAANVVRYVQESHSVPLMLVDLASRRVTIGIDGTALIRSEPPADAESIDCALQHIEDYVNTVDWGSGQDPLFANEHIAAFAAGKTFADYEGDAMLRSAVERQFEIVGEALAQLSRLDEATAARITEYRRKWTTAWYGTSSRRGFRRCAVRWPLCWRNETGAELRGSSAEPAA